MFEIGGFFLPKLRKLKEATDARYTKMYEKVFVVRTEDTRKLRSLEFRSEDEALYLFSFEVLGEPR